MEIRFQDKATSNQLQREAFLALSPLEQFWAFIKLNAEVGHLHGVPEKNDDSFKIVLNVNDLERKD